MVLKENLVHICGPVVVSTKSRCLHCHLNQSLKDISRHVNFPIIKLMAGMYEVWPADDSLPFFPCASSEGYSRGCQIAAQFGKWHWRVVFEPAGILVPRIGLQMGRHQRNLVRCDTYGIWNWSLCCNAWAKVLNSQGSTHMQQPCVEGKCAKV